MPDSEASAATLRLRASSLAPAIVTPAPLGTSLRTEAPEPIVRRWSIPFASPPTTPLPASADAALIAQFDARVARVFALFAAALDPARPVPVDDLRHALHQLAGTAAFFGQRALGALAQDLDDQLAGGSAIATEAFLSRSLAHLRDAMVGA